VAKKLLKLNLGCGANKLDGYVNIDSEPSVKPDILANMLDKLPYKANSVDEVAMFHVVEHISKHSHLKLFTEIWRVLKPGGTLLLAYPEFQKVVKNWEINLRGQKDFWEATIYGRQLFPGDFHVTIMHTPDFKKKLKAWGFENIFACPEANQDFNTVIDCNKGSKPKNYEDLIREDMVSHKFKRITPR